jgi:hypothetical protein
VLGRTATEDVDLAPTLDHFAVATNWLYRRSDLHNTLLKASKRSANLAAPFAKSSNKIGHLQWTRPLISGLKGTHGAQMSCIKRPEFYIFPGPLQALHPQKSRPLFTIWGLLMGILASPAHLNGKTGKTPYKTGESTLVGGELISLPYLLRRLIKLPERRRCG